MSPVSEATTERGASHLVGLPKLPPHRQHDNRHICALSSGSEDLFRRTGEHRVCMSLGADSPDALTNTLRPCEWAHRNIIGLNLTK